MKKRLLQTDKTLDLCFYIIGWALTGLTLVLWYVWNRGLRDVLPVMPCPVHTLTGFYCPGCGGTRAVSALLHGKLLTSFLYHPIVPYTAICGGWFMLSQTIERLSFGKCAIGLHYRDLYLWLALLIVLGNCLIKNLLLAFTGLAMPD